MEKAGTGPAPKPPKLALVESRKFGRWQTNAMRGFVKSRESAGQTVQVHQFGHQHRVEVFDISPDEIVDNDPGRAPYD